MILYDPISQGTAVVQSSARDQFVVISYPPTLVTDSSAAIAQLTDSASTRSFMQDQWRSVSANMAGVGAVVNGIY
ncbi:MAG: hypothetical protein LBR22_06395 [Desulfovibrio sp.]|jgi:hypothetical protein|nr:hypothetical protein [Desulfovibrio sp.]